MRRLLAHVLSHVLFWVVLLLLSAVAQADPAVVASGSYPEGLLSYQGRIYFTEMGADRVTIIENGKTREFWQKPGFPTPIGVLRAWENVPRYEDLIAAQIAEVQSRRGKGDLEKLLRAGDTWEVRG